MRVSSKTLAALCETLGVAVRTHAEMERLFLEYDVEDFDKARYINGRVNDLVNGIRKKYEGDPKRQEEIFLELCQLGLKTYIPNPKVQARLQGSLNLDGFSWDGNRLLPSTPAPTSLENEISQFEYDLEQRGLSIALTHYSQACANYVQGNWEAVNGQVRAYLEDLLIEVGKSKGGPGNNVPASLQYLRDKKYIDNAEWQFCKGIWQGNQDKGPHRGLSDQQEAIFRLHVATALGRYFLAKL